MGLNWRKAFQAGALSAGDVAGQAVSVRISDQVAQKRELRMRKYQQADVADERNYQGEVRAEGQDFQREMMGAQGEAAAAQAGAKRTAELEDLTRKENFEREKIEMSAKLDPKAPVNNVSVDTGKNEFTSALDKEDAAMYKGLREAAVSAGKTEATLSVLEEIGASSVTGVTPEILAKIGSVFGTDAGASMQAYQAAVTPLILDQTSKLAGVISDKDMEVIKSSMPSFATDARANKIIIGIIRKGMQDAQTLYGEATDYLEASENYSLRGWRPSLAVSGPPSELAEENISAAENPVGVIQDFDAWDKAN